MRREIILLGDSVVVDPGGSLDPGTSPYPWANTPNKTLFDVWNGIQTETEYAYHWPGNSLDLIAMAFAPGPTLARFVNVRIDAAFDYSQSGPNNWFFPPDNAAGPSCGIRLRARDLSTWLAGPGGSSYTVIDTDPYNVNISGSTAFAVKLLSWDMSAHPEGGPWTLEDINDLAVGMAFGTSNGPGGRPYDPSQGSFFKIRVPYVTVTLLVEDLGGDVANMRHASSMALRLMRRSRGALTPVILPARRAVGNVGSRVYLSHSKGPSIGGHGWGQRRLERRLGLILRRRYHPESLKVEDEILDMHPIACLWWAAYRIDGPWSTELQGLALIDKGRGLTHTRAQDAWSPRPGDGILLRVLEDCPNLSFEGLAVQGGGDEAICLRNYDLMQAGWSTVASAGSFTATADLTVSMVEEQGYLSSARLDYGGGGGTGARERSLGTLPYASGDRIHVRVGIRNTSVPTPGSQNAELRLRRTGGGLAADEYWDEAGRAWTTTPTYIAIPSAEPYGETVLDAVPCDAAGASSDPTYHIAVGRFSSALTSVTFHGALVDVQHSDDTVAGARTPLVTLAATITREADEHKMEQVWGRDLWVHERGVQVAEVRPFWRAVDLPADAVKPILHAQHTATDWDALQFIPKTGTDDLIRFERALDGEATYQLDCPITGINLTRLHVLRTWCRWLGADGWKEYGPYSVEVGYAVFLEATGALVGSGSVVGTLSSTTAVPTARDFLGIGFDGTRFLDGWIRMGEGRRNPLHGLEAVWKL